MHSLTEEPFNKYRSLKVNETVSPTRVLLMSIAPFSAALKTGQEMVSLWAVKRRFSLSKSSHAYQILLSTQKVQKLYLPSHDRDLETQECLPND